MAHVALSKNRSEKEGEFLVDWPDLLVDPYHRRNVSRGP
jgi:hypothetical protein